MNHRFAPLSCSILLLLALPMLSLVNGDDSTAPSSADLKVLQLVNDYRQNVSRLPALGRNDAAFCVGRQVVQTFVNTACTNSTGAFSPYDEDENIPGFQNILTNCHVALVNVTKGYIAVDCVPQGISSSNGPTVAAQNFTRAPKYGRKINDTSFTSAGVGSDGIWYALVLATNTVDGNYGVTPGLNENSATSSRIGQSPIVWTPIIVLLAHFCSKFGISGLW